MPSGIQSLYCIWEKRKFTKNCPSVEERHNGQSGTQTGQRILKNLIEFIQAERI